MMPADTVSFLALLSGVIGIILAFAGLLFGLREKQNRTKIEVIFNVHLAETLNRVRSTMPYRYEVESVFKDIDNRDVLKWAWVKYKALSDLYVMLVRHYLSTQNNFTYNDIHRLVNQKVILTAWEEGVWRDLIAFRKENSKQSEVLPPTIQDNLQRWDVATGAFPEGSHEYSRREESLPSNNSAQPTAPKLDDSSGSR